MRTLRAALICGVLAASLAGFLWTLGAFTPWTQSLFGTGSAELPSAFWSQWAGALLLGLGLAWTTVDLSAVSLKITVAAVAMAEVVLLSWVLFLSGVTWPPFTTLAAGLFATAFGAIYCMSKPGRRKREIETIFSGRISRKTYCKILDSDEPIPLSGDEREASVVVCRIFNRRELASALSASDFVALSNRFLEAVSNTLLEAGGVMAECGEGHTYAVFGMPLSAPNHAVQACEAALKLKDRLEMLRGECVEQWGIAPDVRIAVNSGSMIAGAFGFSTQGGFGVVGEALDACRRLCRANMIYGTHMLTGPRTFHLLQNAIPARPVDLIWNHEEGVLDEIYEPSGMLTPEVLPQWRDQFWIAVILYREKKWDAAVAQFEALLQETEDPLVKFYLERIEQSRKAA